ncbi:MAG: DUF92 domain-containing protein [Candidatus Tectomicrobia bacterium]
MPDVVRVALVLGALGVCLFGIPAILKGNVISKSDVRSLTHAVCFSLLAAAIFFLQNKWVAIIAGVPVILFLIAAIEWDWLPGLTLGSRDRDYGLVGSALGFVAVAYLFFPHKAVIAAALLIVGIGDAAASVVGRHFGRHPIQAWGSRRTVEGSLALAVVAFAVSLACFFTTGRLTLHEVGLSTFVGFTTALIELILPSAIDNIVIPVWAGFLLLLAEIRGSEIIMNWPLAVIIAAVCAPLFYKLKWLDAPGSAAAALVAAVAVALGGWTWLLPITVFFSSTSLLTKFKQTDASGRKPRGLQQVYVNGILPILPVLGHAVDGRPIWYFLYVGAVAVANADTWSTEVGRLSRSKPISLRTLGRVPRGISGAMSPLGTVASVCGGVLIGGTVAVVAQPEWQRYLLFVGIVIGPLGAFIDSLLGAWVQCRYRCGSCDLIGEETTHCGNTGQRVFGLRGVNNGTVNALANISGMILAFTLYDYIE